MVEAMGVPGCRVMGATELDGGLTLSVERHECGERCPACGRPRRAGHGRYRRRPADLPCLGRSMRLDFEVRRLRCASTACPRRTFIEQVPSLVTPRARRTRRLAEAQSRIGLATSAAAGARLAGALETPASASTVLRPVARRARAAGGNAPCGRRRRLGVAEEAPLGDPRGRSRAPADPRPPVRPLEAASGRVAAPSSSESRS